jgi:hypothetical protein
LFQHTRYAHVKNRVNSRTLNKNMCAYQNRYHKYLYGRNNYLCNYNLTRAHIHFLLHLDHRYGRYYRHQAHPRLTAIQVKMSLYHNLSYDHNRYRELSDGDRYGCGANPHWYILQNYCIYPAMLQLFCIQLCSLCRCYRRRHCRCRMIAHINATGCPQL